MSVVRKFRPKLRLTALMKQPGGIRVGEALRKAGESLVDFREDSLSGIDELLDLMEAQVTATAAARARPDLESIYSMSTRIIDLCGALEEGGLDQAARSLCDYVDSIGEDAPADVRVIQVHMASMRLLHRTDAGPEARGEILRGLSQVVERQARS